MRRFATTRPRERSRGGHEVAFRHVPNGIQGLETRMPLLYSQGVLEGRLTINRFVELTGHQSSQGLRLASSQGHDRDRRRCRPGGLGRAARGLRNADLHHDVDYTPYEGQQLRAAGPE